MSELNLNISAITVNVHGLSVSVKMQRLSNWVKKNP